MRAGIMGGYSHSNVNVNALGSSAGIDSAQLGAYASACLGAFHLRSGAAGSFNAIDASRMVALSGFADNDACAFQRLHRTGFGEFAYGMAFDQIALEPFAGLGLCAGQ